MSNWYIIYNGQRVGPMSSENLRAYSLTPDSLVWREGMADWQAVYTIPELMEVINGMPAAPAPQSTPGAYPPPAAPNYTKSDKDKTTAGILALLLGGLGIQYFYLGKTSAGLITILLSIVTCGFWSVLTFIQGILILVMSDQEFNRKFVYTEKSFPLF